MKKLLPLHSAIEGKRMFSEWLDKGLKKAVSEYADADLTETESLELFTKIVCR